METDQDFRMRESWSDIVAFLRGLNLDHAEYASAVKAIADVADFVAAASLNLGMYGWTSMHDLCIQQTDVEPYTSPYLRLSPLKSGSVEFRYFDTGIENRRWARTVPAEQAVKRFAKFLKQLHWVAEVRAAR
jgi:hypothetical protein